MVALIFNVLLLTLLGDYTNGSGNQLVANRNLSLNFGGHSSSLGNATLRVVRNLSVTVANINSAGISLDGGWCI